MVDAHAVDQAFAVEAQDRFVARLEHAVELGAQAGERVDIEKAPPVDFVGRRAPPGEAEVLLVQQAMQQIAAGFGRLAIGAQRGFDRACQFGAAEHFARGNGRAAHGVPVGGHVGKGAGGFFEHAALGEQDGSVGARVYPETVVVISDEQPAVLRVEFQLEFAVGQGLAVRLAQEGREHAATQGRVRRIPVYVEELGVGAGAAPFQHIQPPGIFRAAYAHVVGHDVQDQAHVVGAQRGDEVAQRVLTA